MAEEDKNIQQNTVDAEKTERSDVTDVINRMREKKKSSSYTRCGHNRSMCSIGYCYFNSV